MIDIETAQQMVPEKENSNVTESEVKDDNEESRLQINVMGLITTSQLLK
jgi:hypothetical protein